MACIIPCDLIIGEKSAEARLGAGRFGEVFRAEQKRSGPVALKCVGSLAQFREELDLHFALSLRVAGVCQLFGLCVDHRVFGTCFVMKLYICSLDDEIERGPILLPRAIDICATLAQTVATLHDPHQILIADLKPANILIDEHGRPVLSDFGVSQTLETAMLTKGISSSRVSGTVHYMSPEQLGAEDEDENPLRVTLKSDAWSWGCTVFHMITSKLPWTDPKTGAPLTERKVVTNVAMRMRSPALSSLPASVPPALRELLVACLKPLAADRPAFGGDDGIAAGIGAVWSEIAPSEVAPEEQIVEKIGGGGGGAGEVPAAAAAVVRSGGAASKRPPAPPAMGGEKGIRVSGHMGTQSGMMGVYARDAAHSLKRGKNVYSLVGGSGVHLHEATNGVWHITTSTANMVAGEPRGWITSTTANPSPLGLPWKAYDGTTHILDPLLTVTEMSVAELAAAEAETHRILAIRAVRVSGHTGAMSGRMGDYAWDATHSPKRGKNVYSLVGASGVHLHHVTNGKWYISDTANMIEGFAGGFIGSTTASPSPLGLAWKYNDSGSGFHLEPLLRVTEISAADLAAARATAEAETQRGLAIRAVRVSGHTGVHSDVMGDYAHDTMRSPKRGKNVYSLEGTRGVHLHHATDGAWYISDTADMIAGEGTGWIMSRMASPSPLGLQWKTSAGPDPLLTVTER